MTITQIKRESTIMNTMHEKGEADLLIGHACIVVPITLWRRLRSLLAMHERVSQEMIRLEQEGREEPRKKPVRAALIRDIAKADGNETHRMDIDTIEIMYGGIADTILSRYNVSVRKERKSTNGAQPR